jgi:thioredoxin reductase (NADPH)
MIEKREVVIVGAGPAGLSAGIWCAELGLDAVVLEANTAAGGQLLLTFNEIRDHLGRKARNGREMRDAFLEQAAEFGINLRRSIKVEGVDIDGRRVLIAGQEPIEFRWLIIAMGLRRRRLGIPGEAEFQGRGILVSGKRDKDLAAGKTACVIGGGDAALENALILSEVCPKVTLAHRRSEFRGREEFLSKVKATENIELLTDTVVEEICGGEAVQSVKLRNFKADETSELAAEAILIRIGMEPDTEIFRGNLALDDHGYIAIDSRCETSIPGVFAVGDIANPSAPTISAATGHGAIAAKVIKSEHSLNYE